MTVALLLLTVLLLASCAACLFLLRAQQRSAIAYARCEAECDFLQEQLRDYRAAEGERAAVLRQEMEALSQRIFAEKTSNLTLLGKSTLAEVVAPVQQELLRLQKSLQESNQNEAVRAERLASSLQRVLELNTQLGSQAEGLAKALKGDNKMVGDFGEVLLERLLECAGLRKGEHFIEQGIGLGLQSEAGTPLRPDVLILLPEKRCLVVDSKMSLLSWVHAQSQEEPGRTLQLKAFRQSVRAHIDNLAGKSYVESLHATELSSIDFKFLFMPIEAAFHACLQLDPELYAYAFDRRIILTSPTTLLATLTTVHHTWRQYDIGRNAQDISDRAGKLLDKLHDFLSALEDVGRHLDKAQGAYQTAHVRLLSGNGHLIGQAEKLKELGVKSRKGLPPSFRGAVEN